MLDVMFRSLRAFWLGFAPATRGGTTLEFPGVGAAIVPAIPQRSVVNCVVYEDADALEAQLDRLAEAYDEARIKAWTVWVHESDKRAQELLSEAGHVLDAEPMAQARALDGLEQPEEDRKSGVEGK